MTTVVAEHRVNRHRLLLDERIPHTIIEYQALRNVAMQVQVHASLTLSTACIGHHRAFLIQSKIPPRHSECRDRYSFEHLNVANDWGV